MQSGVLLTVDNFDRLLASGRVSRGKAWLASVFGIKPVLWVPTDGRPVEAVGKALGRRRVLPAMLNTLRGKLPENPRSSRFGIAHVGYPEIVDVVRDALLDEYGEVEILSAPATPVIATHTGIGAWAIAYILED